MYGIGMSSSAAKRAFVSRVIVDMAAPLLQSSRLGAETPLQEVADLLRTRQPLRDHLGQRDERVNLPGVLAIDHVDSSGAQLVGVGRSLVAERVEARRDDERRRLAFQIGRPERRGAEVRLVR